MQGTHAPCRACDAASGLRRSAQQIFQLLLEQCPGSAERRGSQSTLECSFLRYLSTCSGKLHGLHDCNVWSQSTLDCSSLRHLSTCSGKLHGWHDCNVSHKGSTGQAGNLWLLFMKGRRSFLSLTSNCINTCKRVRCSAHQLAQTRTTSSDRNMDTGLPTRSTFSSGIKSCKQLRTARGSAVRSRAQSRCR